MNRPSLDPRNCYNESAYFCAKSKTPLVIIGSILVWLILCVSIIGNILVLLNGLLFPHLRKSMTNLFIFSLALSDFLIGMIVMPFYTLNSIYCGCWHYGFLLCRIFISNGIFCCTASIVNLFCISLDRYIAVIYPFKYASTMTRKRVILLIISCWIYSLTLSYIPIHTNIYISKISNNKFDTDSYYCHFDMNALYCIISTSLSFYIPGLFMTILYLRIFYIARLNEKTAIKLCELNKYHENMNSLDGNNNLLTQNVIRRERKVIKTIGLIIGCFIVCWLGVFVYLILVYVFKIQTTPHEVVDFFFILGYFNSCINPFIYAFYHNEFKVAFKKIWCDNIIGNSWLTSLGSAPRTFSYKISQLNRRSNNIKSSNKSGGLSSIYLSISSNENCQGKAAKQTISDLNTIEIIKEIELMQCD